ncbi:MAG: hypothetical protein MUP41_07895 [Desulfobacterales bacterium]|nr:hypothetical protein [Desulfobacterales bacterium]
MEKDQQYQNILGKLIVAFILIYFLLYYHYQITDFILGRWSAWWAWYNRFLQSWWTSDDPDISILSVLWDIVKFVLYVIAMIVFALAVLILAGVVHMVGILNKYYILPCILPFFIIYSKFSYSAVVRPLIWASAFPLLVLKSIVKAISKVGYFFLIMPITEIITLRTRASKINIVYLSLFICASTLIFIGSLGVASKTFRGEGIPKKLSSVFSFVRRRAPEAFIQKYQTIKIEANHPFWTDTEILIHPDDRISFSAEGEVSSTKYWRYICRPEGFGDIPAKLPKRIRRELGVGVNFFEMADAPIGGLIGKIGTGTPFYIGKSSQITASLEGHLLLGINDIWMADTWADNQGYFLVNVIVTRN